MTLTGDDDIVQLMMKLDRLRDRSMEMKKRQIVGNEALSLTQVIDGFSIHRVRWTKVQHQRATKPVVYIFWRLDKDGKRTALYVGKSKYGLVRPLSQDHHRADIRDMADELEFIICKSEARCCALERRLIRYLKPLYNAGGVGEEEQEWVFSRVRREIEKESGLKSTSWK